MFLRLFFIVLMASVTVHSAEKEEPTENADADEQKEIFNDMDKDKDGKISKDEILKSMQEHDIEGEEEPEEVKKEKEAFTTKLEKHFPVVDAEKDGFLTL